MKRVTMKRITEELHIVGFPESMGVAKGYAYFYFFGGNTNTWKETIVYAYRLSDLTITQWVEEAQVLAQDRSNR